MESRVDSQDPIQEEVWQLLERLRVVARTVKLSNAALARRARVPIASLVRYFHGQGEPKLQFLLAVVRACGLEVREFFELAYPELEAPTAARLKLDYSLGPLRPVKRLPSPPLEDGPQPVTREDVEQMMVQLREEVRALWEEEPREEPPSPELPNPPEEDGGS